MGKQYQLIEISAESHIGSLPFKFVCATMCSLVISLC